MQILLQDKYNIGVLTVNIEFMWRGLETGEIQAVVSLYIRFVPSHINYIFTINTPILYIYSDKRSEGKYNWCYATQHEVQENYETHVRWK